MGSKERGRNEPREEVSYIQVLEVQDMTMGTQTAILRGNPVGLVAILDSVFTILSLVSTLINLEKLPSLSCHYSVHFEESHRSEVEKICHQ